MRQNVPVLSREPLDGVPSAMTEVPAITVVLSDDHHVVRSGLRVLLDGGGRFSVVGEADDIGSTLERVRTLRPQVLVLDLNLGGESGLEIIPQLREESPETQIVVLTMQENPAFARAAMRAGALGYVLKDAADDELMDAIEAAAVGRSYLNPQLGARLAAAPTESQHPAGRLSPREREVLTLIALGYTNPEIAESLSLSVRTVESHRAHIQQKTNLTSRADLVAYAHENGLIQ
ncbi:MAG TPA: response regulator transcription factor [Solirubrobacteraceae bacterium]|nr:response regulator transcription factor [Solirubrobacteraceae bacterium]